MTTLADVNSQLIKQNELQEEQNNLSALQAGAITGLASGLSSLINTFKSEEMDKLEEERERSKARAAVNTKSASSSGGKEGGGLLDALGIAIPAGGLFGIASGLVSQLPKFLLGRALPALLAKMFADEIADYVESATGSKSLGDAIYRGLNLGALGLLVSKKLGVIGFFGGALLDQQNRDKLNQLGVTLGDFADKVAGFFGTTLPDFQTAMAWVTETFGKAIDFLISGVGYLNLLMKEDKTAKDIEAMEGDLETLSSHVDEFALAIGGMALMFRRTRKLLGSMVSGIFSATKAGGKALAGIGAGGAVAAGTGAAATAAAMSREEMIKETGKMSNKQLAKLGFEKTAAGGIVQAGTNRAVSNEALKGALDMKAASKFPKMAKFLKFGPIGALLAGYDIYSILSQPGTVEEKVASLSGVLAAVLGGGGGAALGAAMGSVFPGPGTLIGGILGGGIGYFAGGSVGKGLAQYLLGQKVDAMPFDSLNDMLNGTGANSFGSGRGTVTEAPGARSGGLNPQASPAFTPMTGSNLQAMTQEQAAMNNAPASANIVDASDKSVSVINNSGMTVTGPIGTPFDTYNKYVLYA